MFRLDGGSVGIEKSWRNFILIRHFKPSVNLRYSTRGFNDSKNNTRHECDGNSKNIFWPSKTRDRVNAVTSPRTGRRIRTSEVWHRRVAYLRRRRDRRTWTVWRRRRRVGRWEWWRSACDSDCCRRPVRAAPPLDVRRRLLRVLPRRRPVVQSISGAWWRRLPVSEMDDGRFVRNL